MFITFTLTVFCMSRYFRCCWERKQCRGVATATLPPARKSLSADAGPDNDAAWGRRVVTNLTPSPGDGTKLRPYTFVTGATEHAFKYMYDAEIHEQAVRQGLHDAHAIGNIIQYAVGARVFHPVCDATGTYFGPVQHDNMYPDVCKPTMWYSMISVPPNRLPPKNVCYVTLGDTVFAL
jgi:hypothetical protein